MILHTFCVVAAVLCAVYTETEGKKCQSNGGLCQPKALSKDCGRLPYTCPGARNVCCDAKQSPASNSNENGSGNGTKRKCKKTSRRCSKQQGTCVPVRNLNCPTLAIDSFCKGGSCTCCLRDKESCNILPGCKERGGFCMSKKLSSFCSKGVVDASLCGSRKCVCCIAEDTCKCGQTNEVRIVGGEEVSPQNKYPWMVSILVFNVVNCGASLINDRYVITAAHCMADESGKPYNVTDIKVGLAEHNTASTADDVPGVTRQVEIEAYKVHESYNFPPSLNDIALVKLKEPLDLSISDEIKPVCLPANAEKTYEAETGIIAGWGKLDSNDTTISDVLRETTVPILSPECEGNIPEAIVDKTNIICAGFKEGGKDTCQGDSGGPLVVKEESVHVLVGITSVGEGCAEPDSPGVYTRVTSYLDWIMSNTADAKYC